MAEKQEMTMQELERKMMQELYKDLKRDNIPSVDGEVYLSDGVVLTESGEVIEHHPMKLEKGILKKIHNKK